MSIIQTTPFSLFLYDNMDEIRSPFMTPDEVLKIAEEIWEHLPHDLKFNYFKNAHDLFIERNHCFPNHMSNKPENINEISINIFNENNKDNNKENNNENNKIINDLIL